MNYTKKQLEIQRKQQESDEPVTIEFKDEKPIDELLELLSIPTQYRLHKETGVSTGTLTNLNNGVCKAATLKFFPQLALEALRELPKDKRLKIFQAVKEKT